MPNEFNVITKNILDPQHQMVQFSGLLAEGETVMTKLQQMLSVQMPEAGGDVERVQQFVTRAVPTGKQLVMKAVITCALKDV